MRLTPPAYGKGSVRPVDRQLRHQFSTVLRLTENDFAILACDKSVFRTALMTRSRRSGEYAFMSFNLLHLCLEVNRNLL